MEVLGWGRGWRPAYFSSAVLGQMEGPEWRWVEACLFFFCSFGADEGSGMGMGGGLPLLHLLYLGADGGSGIGRGRRPVSSFVWKSAKELASFYVHRLCEIWGCIFCRE